MKLEKLKEKYGEEIRIETPTLNGFAVKMILAI